jgi:hypothetical protein
MASFRGLVAVAGASSTTCGLLTEGCLQQSPAIRRGGGGGYEAKEGACLRSASTFCGERSGLLSSVSKPVDAFTARTSKVRAYSTGGATTTKEEQQQYGGSSSSGYKEMRSPAYPAAGVRRSLYDVLGISKTASAKEIKAAYRQAARKLHPDVVPAEQREDSTKMFLQMQNAYNVLSDDESRAAYDLQLSIQSSYITSCNWGFTTASSPSSGGPVSYPAADFSSAFKGRSWETDQCW